MEINLEKKFWKKKFQEKILENFEKKFRQFRKNFGKINYKTKIFITKIYVNIYSHTIFALLAPFDKTGRKTESN